MIVKELTEEQAENFFKQWASSNKALYAWTKQIVAEAKKQGYDVKIFEDCIMLKPETNDDTIQQES